MAHALSQNWRFPWLHLTKEEFKLKIAELRINYLIIPLPHQREQPDLSVGFFPLVGQFNE